MAARKFRKSHCGIKAMKLQGGGSDEKSAMMARVRSPNQPLQLVDSSSMRQAQEFVEEPQFLHDVQGRGMDRVAAEVAQEIGVLFHDNDIDAGARQQKPEHHPRRDRRRRLRCSSAHSKRRRFAQCNLPIVRCARIVKAIVGHRLERVQTRRVWAFNCRAARLSYRLAQGAYGRERIDAGDAKRRRSSQFRLARAAVNLRQCHDQRSFRPSRRLLVRRAGRYGGA